VRTRRRLLGVITLDLFVVLLGGVTATAADLCAQGYPERRGLWDLGLLRSAPAAGALITAIVLSRYPVERHIGRKMFSVGRDLWRHDYCVRAVDVVPAFAVRCWPCLGASDAFSVVIRFSLVQIETPDAMRGRVSAINYLLVGSSNTLGEFESGMVAGWLGAVPSVLVGGHRFAAGGGDLDGIVSGFAAYRPVRARG
jgi:hypothetical protein